jgi:hypothetical protein
MPLPTIAEDQITTPILTMRRMNVLCHTFSLSIACCLFLLLVPATSRAQGADNALLDLARIQENVQSKRVSSYNRTGANADRFENIEDGETRTIFDVDGAGIINHIWITIAPPPNQLRRNDIILRMYWDGEEEPSVEAPIGPFFGQGWGESYEFRGLPLSVAPRDGRSLVSYFTMPFSENARIEIENQTGRPINAFYFYIDYVDMDELPDDMGRFHAQYRHELTEAMEGSDASVEDEIDGLAHNLRAERNQAEDRNNYLFADIEGKGHFVGVNYYIHSPTTVWYGEGDDMFRIDGEEWPVSLHGTGTEDYFNTAWVPKTEFQHPYYGLARVNNNIGWLGRTHVYRFHITDPIYFNESLRASIEHGHNNNLTLDLRSVAYWYQREPHKPFPPLPSAEERQPQPTIGPREIQRWRQFWRRHHEDAGPFLWGNEREAREDD